MNSPFPGVDPYLESHWGDIHTSLMVYMRDQIDEQLPSGLQARVEESISVDLDESSRWVYPDVKVVEQDISSGSIGVIRTSVAATVVEPTLIPVPNELIADRHIEIVDLNSGNRVVTAIELLSPTNKVEPVGRQAYRRKQLEYIAGRVNLVEIDLIRAGDFIVAVPQSRIAREKRTPFMICIRRVRRPTMAEIIPIAIDQSIPDFQIPLRLTDPDAVLRLQPLLDECYRRGRYASIDYTKSPRPSLDEREEVWANQLLQEKGLRPNRRSITH